MDFELHQGYRPTAIGRIVEMHARYYSERVGFGLPFEAKVARELTGFCENHDAHRDGLWLLLQKGRVEGSIVIDGSHAAESGAHLRWFIVSERLRGHGAGRALLDSAMAFCRARQYRRTFLWTFEGLQAARHLYESAGFALVHQAPGSQWGAEVTEQRFEREV